MNKPTNQAEMVAALATLQPPSKKIYAWPSNIPWLMDPANKDLITQLIRLNGTINIWADWDMSAQLDLMVSYAKAAGLTPSIGVTADPWTRKFTSNDPRLWDATATADIDFQRTNLQRVATSLAAVNAKYAMALRVGVVSYDQESLTLQGSQSIDENRNTKNLISYSLAQQIFPGAYVHQYGRGSSPGYSAGDTGDGYSVSLYYGAELEYQLRLFRDLCATVAQPVVPAIALGWSFKRGLNGWQPVSAPLQQYPYANSFSLGWLLCNSWFWDPSRVGKYADFSRASFAYLWPACFDSVAAPDFGNHYLAFIWGTNTSGVAPTEGWLNQ